MDKTCTLCDGIITPQIIIYPNALYMVDGVEKCLSLTDMDGGSYFFHHDCHVVSHAHDVVGLVDYLEGLHQCVECLEPITEGIIHPECKSRLVDAYKKHVGMYLCRCEWCDGVFQEVPSMMPILDDGDLVVVHKHCQQVW